jgi:NAD(P)-dependent dehydrogenase (short-subunit alcohol dehydrogenase family)
MASLVLITGTSSGIGLAGAIACAERGFDVIATMRNLERREQLDREVELRELAPRSSSEPTPEEGRIQGVVHVEQLDVTAEGVGDKVRELLLKYGPIEHLVNNAGIAVSGAFEEQSERDIRDQFDTNVLGMMEVTRALLPSMRASGRGRILNVSSIVGRIGLPGMAAYAATKHAINGFSEALRYEVAQFGIQVCVVEPGTFKTGIFRNQRRGHLVDENGPYAELTASLMRAVTTLSEAADGPEVAGEKVADLLEVDSPPFRTIVGNQARAAAALKRVAPEGLFSTAVRRLMRL